ncbi:MAG: MoaD/ThiS family protein [Phycisphaerales bacterium]
MIRVQLPFHLRTLARVDGNEVTVEVGGESSSLPTPTIGAVLDALEARYPVLRGAIRDHVTRERRPFLRYYACREDLSLAPPETTPLPPAILRGDEPFMVIGAIAGG